MAVVQGEVSDVLRRLSVTQNNVVKKKKEKDKKGILHDYLKDNPHAEKSVVPAKRSATAAKKTKKAASNKKDSTSSGGRQSLAEYMKKFT